MDKAQRESLRASGLAHAATHRSNQTLPMRALLDILENGASLGMTGYNGACMHVDVQPQPRDTDREKFSGVYALTSEDMLLSAAYWQHSETLTATRALFDTLLWHGMQCATLDHMLAVLHHMARTDLSTIAVDAGMQTDVDRVTGQGRYSPRIATMCSWLVVSVLYVAQQLREMYRRYDVLSDAQIAYWTRYDAAQAQTDRIARMRHVAHTRLSGKHTDRFQDTDTKRNHRRVVSHMTDRRPKGYRHH